MRKKVLKEMTYLTRRMRPGDVFEVPDTKKDRQYVRVLEARKYCEPLRDEAVVPPPPLAVAEKIAAVVAPPEFVDALRSDVIFAAASSNDLAAARADYEKALGKRPFHGWDAETLRKKIAEKADA